MKRTPNSQLKGKHGVAISMTDAVTATIESSNIIRGCRGDSYKGPSTE